MTVFFLGAKKHCKRIKVIGIIKLHQMNQIIFSFWNIFTVKKLLPKNKYSRKNTHIIEDTGKVYRRTINRRTHMWRNFHQMNQIICNFWNFSARPKILQKVYIRRKNYRQPLECRIAIKTCKYVCELDRKRISSHQFSPNESNNMRFLGNFGKTRNMAKESIFILN